MKKKLALFVLTLGIVSMSFLPVAFASGWSFALNNAGEYWASSPVQTSYPYLQFEIKWVFAPGNQGTGWMLNNACTKVQKLSGGRWVDVTSPACEQHDGRVYTIAASPGVSYRVFVECTGGMGAHGTVSYRGLNSP